MISLNTPVKNLQMVGETYSNRLKKLGIETVSDLLHHIPSRYVDFSVVSKIGNLQEGEKVTVVGRITAIENTYTRNRREIQKAKIADCTSSVGVVWYNQPFLVKILPVGTHVRLAGVVKSFAQKKVLQSPDYEIIRGGSSKLVHTGRLVPIYPETYGITSKWLRWRIYSLLYNIKPEIIEFLPFSIINRFKLLNYQMAIYKIHFPKSLKEAEKSRRRLAFDELLLRQLEAASRKQQWSRQRVNHRLNIKKNLQKIIDFVNKLPFKLTSAQKKAISEILRDLEKEKPMNRLLEGDVGSGKTVVATIAMYATHLSTHQSVLMAPTQILAQQHYETVNSFLADYKLSIGLVTAQKKTNADNCNILIGTQALISNKINFEKLGLVIIDEQQRFGVKQRAQLREKGASPHVLTMTATPIPRTIALTLYADLDLSVIDQNPPGRKKVKTWVVPPKKRDSAYQWIREQIKDKKSLISPQAFIICPLIEESESLVSVKAVTTEYNRLKTKVFPDLKLGLLHGKLKQKQREKIIKDFKKGTYDILVSTPVVEVGIDIPTASIMLIEAADRFGLAQLHQLRGRVGRGEVQSYCLLFTESDSPQTLNRLKQLESIYIGPRLAEIDLSLRGPGQIYGTKQHGSLDLKIANLGDLSLIKETKKAAAMLLSQNGNLDKFPILKERVKNYTISKKVAPD